MSGEIKLDPRKALRKSTCGEVKLKRTRPRDDLSGVYGKIRQIVDSAVLRRDELEHVGLLESFGTSAAEYM